ncbi:MAG: hypothetical protein JO100_17255 [Pseudonocardia sp.]|nr:hypothetical protein [Pseudonocardia sp.]
MTAGETPAPGARRRTTARSSLTVSVWTMVSRITGLARVAVIGAVLGPTYFSNVFVQANQVPNWIFTATAGPVLALVLVPALVRSLVSAGPQASIELLARVTGYLITRASLGTALLVLASPLIALAPTFGIPDQASRAQAWWLTILVLLFVAPQVVGYMLINIGVAAQQARSRYAIAAAAPAIENIGLIATMSVVALLYQPDLEVAGVPLSMVVLLGLGSTASVVFHAAVQLYGAHRCGMPVRVGRRWQADDAVNEITHRLRRSLVVAVSPSASMFAMLALAGTVPGGSAVFQAGMSVYFVLNALGVKSVNAAALPGMSAANERHDTARFGAAWREALCLGVTASLPAACLLIAFAEPTASVLIQGHLRTPEIMRWVTAALSVFAFAQLANAVGEIGRQALFARLDVRGPRRVSFVNLVVRLGVGLASLALPAGGDRLLGLSCAVLAGEAAGAMLTLWLLHRAIRPQQLFDTARLGRIALAVVAMLPAAGLGYWLVQARVHERFPQLLVAAGLGAVSAVCFGFTLAALSGQLPVIRARLRAKLRVGEPVCAVPSSRGKTAS